MSESPVRKAFVRYTLLSCYRDRFIGYARVSTDDQNLGLQRNAVWRAGCGRIFKTEESGRAGTKRPILEAALAFLRPKNQFVIWRVDRLGRTLREMLDTAHKPHAQWVDTETPTGRLMYNCLGTIAKHFLDLIRKGILEGFKAARRRKGGRRRKPSEEDLAMALTLLKNSSTPWPRLPSR